MKRAGWIIFVAGLLYMVLVGWVGSWINAPQFRNLPLGELQDTMWSLEKPPFWVWAFSVPVGAILAAVGILLHASRNGSRAGLMGVALFLVSGLAYFATRIGHMPLLFGIGGGLILSSFVGILWLWGKRRGSLSGAARVGADLQLVAYVFFITAAWYLCGRLGQPYLASMSELGQSSPLDIMIYLALGWVFLFLGHLKMDRSRS
ncbi:MAG: hypothetical protein GY838_15200 [bacterium]|nr:hypothetical protein [bacterium]